MPTPWTRWPRRPAAATTPTGPWPRNRRREAARRALDWLVRHQRPDGGLGITAEDAAPCWPTPLAILAWQAAIAGGETHYRAPTDRAVAWLLNARGASLPRTRELAHDSTLVGWCWAESTHSWVEPTALAVLALRAVGDGDHPRAVEGRRLLIDRLLPSGGCNYGNTFVLGQKLRPHVQPTALAALALVGEPSHLLETSLLYLERELGPHLATASLSYGLMALAAYGRRPDEADAWLEAALARTLAADRSAYRLALAALAAIGDPLAVLSVEATA